MTGAAVACLILITSTFVGLLLFRNPFSFLVNTFLVFATLSTTVLIRWVWTEQLYRMLGEQTRRTDA